MGLRDKALRIRGFRILGFQVQELEGLEWRLGPLGLGLYWSLGFRVRNWGFGVKELGFKV